MSAKEKRTQQAIDALVKAANRLWAVMNEPEKKPKRRNK